MVALVKPQLPDPPAVVAAVFDSDSSKAVSSQTQGHLPHPCLAKQVSVEIK